MKVYWSDILYPFDEAREVRIFTRRRDRDAYVASEVAMYQDVQVFAHEWEPVADNTRGCLVVYSYREE